MEFNEIVVLFLKFISQRNNFELILEKRNRMKMHQVLESHRNINLSNCNHFFLKKSR